MSETRKRAKGPAPLRAADLARTRRQAVLPPVAAPPATEDSAPAAVVESTTPARPVTTSAAKQPTTKFTASLDFETADQFDHLARVARKRLLRQVDKLDVLKALITLAADDASLRDQVIDLIGERKAGA